MKRILSKITLTAIIATLVFSSQSIFAQQGKDVPEHEVMWKMNYTRILDLREKQNESWMAEGNEVSRYLIEGMMSGKLTGYTSDSLNETLPIDKFVSKMSIAGSEELIDEPGWEDEDEEDTTWDVDEEGEDDDDLDEPMGPDLYLPGQMYILELTEDAIYSRKESRMRYDIQTVTMYVPADLGDNLKGVQEHVVTFKYDDCVKYFESIKWAWFNRYNTQEHRSFSDAMDLRLFASTIVKVSNPDNLYIEDIEGSPEKGIIGSQTAMYKLMEKEHEMYEY